MPKQNDRSCLTIILAAGEGKRMASDIPKVLHPVAGLPMVCHVLDAAGEAGCTATAVVVGNQAERVAACAKQHDASVSVHVQTERKGTAHAVLAAREALKTGFDEVIILFGDVPLIMPQTISAARAALAGGVDIVVMGFETDDPTGYGRLIVEDGSVVAIREHKDASDEEKLITLCNSGIMAFSERCMLDVLDAIGSDNAQGEYYLPDAVEVGRVKGLSVQVVEVPEVETLGVNDRIQLAEVESLWQQRKRRELMLAGVSMAAPDTVIFHHDTQIAPDVVLEPNLVFGAGVKIAKGATVRAFSHLEGTEVGENAIVGPYARLRPGTKLGVGAKVGNFVETKKAIVGDGAKINHLSYVGDATIGERANIGAGTITCNYDGFNKHQTTIGAEAFIATNTSLVAPVSVGKGANTAAGSVITGNIEDGDLGIGRARQVNKKGLGARLRARFAAEKALKNN